MYSAGPLCCRWHCIEQGGQTDKGLSVSGVYLPVVMFETFVCSYKFAGGRSYGHKVDSSMMCYLINITIFIAQYNYAAYVFSDDHKLAEKGTAERCCLCVGSIRGEVGRSSAAQMTWVVLCLMQLTLMMSASLGLHTNTGCSRCYEQCSFLNKVLCMLCMCCAL